MAQDDVNGSEILVAALQRQGVKHAFFLAGAPLIAVEDGCAAAGIAMIDVRHEQAAAMAAHAYSRVLRTPGVCMACSGPGVANLASGIANAFADGAPVVAIGGSSTIVGSLGRGEFQEMDQVELMRSITRWSSRVTDPRRIPEVVDRAFGYAFGGQPGPVYIDLPADVLYAKVPEAEVARVIPSLAQKRHRSMGDPAEIARAIEYMEQAQRPILICGSGVYWSDAGEALRAFVEQSGIPAFTTPQSRGLIREDHPLSFIEARSQAFRQADLIIVVGTRVNYMIGFGTPPRFASDARLIQVDISSAEFGKTRVVDVGIVGDARAVLLQFAAVLADRGDRPRYRAWTDELRSSALRKRVQQETALNIAQVPIHPLRLCKEIRDFMDPDGILCVDGHEILNFARQTIPTFVAGHRLNSGTFGCMGVGLPFGLGAKVAKPDIQVIVLHGDGSFGMNGMEVDTARRHGLNIITVISNNGGWAAIGGGFTAGRELGFTRYDKMAEALGCHGEFVERPQDIRPALERAAASGRPAVVNVLTDPNARSQTAKFGQYQV